ncbi:MAG: reductive dehalogenase [Bacteroidales bacterium]|nr:reductive dehalogenase [Bacteroidales bacterium]
MANNKFKLDRRKFIKTAGLVGGALSLFGAAGAGLAAGKDKDSHTGYGRKFYGEDQFFNRKPFLVDKPTYETIGTPKRIQYIENIFKRNGEMYRLMYPRDKSVPKWSLDQGYETLPEPLKNYYTKDPIAFDEFKKAIKKSEEQHENWPKYKDQYILADAWSTAHSSTMRGRDSFPPEPQDKPEVSDFKGIETEAMELKSPKHGSELIKKIAHSFGATLVGITAVKEEWIYQGYLRGVGKTNFEAPKHWKYAIVIAVPHEWDAMYANPTYGTSYDAYSMLRYISGKLTVFLKEIGYSARAHVPPTSYDIIMPPLAIDAGLGEQGRNGILVTPELGANTRLAAVTTDMPIEPDKPIDIGIKDFCSKCKICADECPSGAISFTDEPEEVIRGFKRWRINHDKCYTVWNSVATSHSRGCRVCLAVCPYSRKNNWIHNIVREVDPRDPTGLFSSGMLAMQKKFFKYHGGQEYLPPPDGNNKTYNEAPDWLRSEEWFNL